MDLRMGVRPNSGPGLLFLAGLCLVGAALYHFFGDGDVTPAGAASTEEPAPWNFACGPEPFAEDQLTATQADWTGQAAAEFPKTNFSLRTIPLGEVEYDGNTRDSIPPVAVPQYVPIGEATDIGDLEPVLSVGINGDYRAYPLRILLWHEIVNEEIGGVPVLISYCPLCNSGIVFDRRVDGQVLEFGNTGRIRYHDMVMYDQTTESWWQQASGEAVIGELTGTCMKPLPARLESVAKFRERAPDGQLLVPEDAAARAYGQSPFRDMEKIPPVIARQYFPYEVPSGVNPMQRIVVVDGQGWTLAYLRQQGTLDSNGLVFNWTEGQNSIHDAQAISQSRDVGNVIVQRRNGSELTDVAYDVIFAFAFAAFYPDAPLHQGNSATPQN